MTHQSRRAVDAARRTVTVCDQLAEFVAEGRDAFMADVRTQWAIELGLIRIGESINRIPSEILGEFDGQPWRQIVAMRNFAAHQYDDLEPSRVWRTLGQDIPQLRTYLVTIMIPALESAGT